nr:MAG TPA: 50S ribosomal protein L2 [Bacteriophage sp.]
MNPIIVFYLGSYIVYNLVYISEYIVSIHIRSYWQFIICQGCHKFWTISR